MIKITKKIHPPKNQRTLLSKQTDGCSREAGMTLPEVLLATLVAAVVVGGGYQLLGFTQKYSKVMQSKTNAETDAFVWAENIRNAIWLRGASATASDAGLGVGPGYLSIVLPNGHQKRYETTCQKITEPGVPSVLARVPLASLNLSQTYPDCGSPCEPGERPVLRTSTVDGNGAVVSSFQLPSDSASGVIAGVFCAKTVKTNYLSTQIWMARAVETGKGNNAPVVRWEVQGHMIPLSPSVTGKFFYTRDE